MMKKAWIIVMILVLLAGTAAADSVTNMHYVYLDWVGEYTGQVDTNGVPFGYGLFMSSKPMNQELWHYIGAWEDGVPEGEGAIYAEDGTIYKGVFSRGELVNGFKYAANGLTVEPVFLERSAVTTEVMYIGNRKSKRFHYPTCRSVTQMSEKNKIEFTSREEAIDNGYVPCGDCNP